MALNWLPWQRALNWDMAARGAWHRTRAARGILTSPLELMSAVRRLFPQPQVFCAFHTKSVGGLWVAPAPEAQIWGEGERRVLTPAHPA